MSTYTPPDAHNVELNFKDALVSVDAHNVELNFGADTLSTASLSATISTEFVSDIQIENIIGAHVNGSINTSFNSSVQLDVVSPSCKLDAVIYTGFEPSMSAFFDINFILGLNLLSDYRYQKSLPALIVQTIRYGKSVFKVHNSAFIFERSLTISNAINSGFAQSNFLQQSIHSIFEETTGLSTDVNLVWQVNDKRFRSRNLVFDESERLLIDRQTNWEEMIRKRKRVTLSHEVAAVVEKRFIFKHDKGLELISMDSIPWDVATAVYYRKSKVDPIEPKPKPEYVGTPDLNFICLCHDIDSHNVILNFGADECLPNLAPVDWWYIVNEIKVTRLDNGQEVQIYSGDYSTDRSSWSWSYNLSIPFYEKSKTEPINGQPVILKIMINGNEHRMLLENISRSRQFGKDVYKLSGRSPTALLDAPYSPTRSFTQENERSSVQLVQAELDRVNSDVVLNWDLIDALGWILPPESLSYSNLTPIAAIKLIVEAAGGFIYSEPASNTLTIKPRYKKTWWDSIAVEEYDRVIPESIVTDQSTDYLHYPDYNGVFLTNDRTGDTGQVKRIGTAGDVLQESINSPLLTSTTVMHSKGREVLAKAGLVENHSLLMPITQEIGLCLPGELVAFNGDWWGIVDGVSGSFTHKLVNQTVSIERVNRE